MISPGRQKGKFFGRLSLAGALCVLTSLASAECSDEWLGVDEIREGGNIELRATNLREYPITFTLRVRTRGLSSDGPKTVTQTLQGEQTQTIMVLRESDKDKQGNYRVSCEWTIGNKDANHDDEQIYLLPYENGRSYRVLQGYGSRFSHRGLEQFAVDFKMDVGTPVHAARDGVVAKIEEANSIGCWEDGCGKYANYIVVLHDDGTTGEYYHLQKDGALVEVGDSVVAGDRIGLSGNTGHTTMPHLHFAVYRASTWGNTQSIPVRFLSDDGVVHTPRRGGRYRAVTANKTSD